MFKETARMEWDSVRELAISSYEPAIRQKWPDYLEEMQGRSLPISRRIPSLTVFSGVADGAGVQLSDIIACNVRTEIAFGLFSDGCTALSWRSDNASWLCQNWDWQEAQKKNLVILTIDQQPKPTIKMVTEAGIIGKIGLNSAGVGVCLNAIRIKGMDPTKLPCHLGLRMVLDSTTREEAVQSLEKYGIASACHMLIADKTGGIGLEWSYKDVQKCTMNASNQVFHSNHYILKHPGVGQDTNWLADSSFRVRHIEELANKIQGEPTKDQLFDIFKDETNYPGAICRAQKKPSTSASLFNIIMDLEAKRADVSLGRPIEPEAHVQLSF